MAMSFCHLISRHRAAATVKYFIMFPRCLDRWVVQRAFMKYGQAFLLKAMVPLVVDGMVVSIMFVIQSPSLNKTTTGDECSSIDW